MPRPTPTTPKGYTRLLHEYNNLNEEYNTLTQQLQDNVKSYQEQISENAAVMNDMQDTINNLRSQMMDGNTSGRISTPVRKGRDVYLYIALSILRSNKVTGFGSAVVRKSAFQLCDCGFDSFVAYSCENIVNKRSAETRELSPGAPVSSHKES